MKFFIGFLLIFQGLLMGAGVEKIEYRGVEIPVVYEVSKDLPVYHLQLIFKNSGSITDGKKAGRAYIASRILNEGTLSEGSLKFAQKLENKAISVSASAGSETFVFDLSSLKEQGALGKKYLKELIEDPNITQKALDKVLTELKGNLLRKNSDFDYLASKRLMENLFVDTPLESPLQGTLESIAKIDLKEVDGFLKENINLENLIVVVGGDIDIESEKKDILKLISSLQKGKVSKTPQITASDNGGVKVEYKDTKQAYIYFGAPYLVNDYKEEGYKAKVASFILGASGFGSRMMEEIRVKRGLAYSAYMRFNLNKTHSYASGYLQTKIASQDEAIKIVKEVVEKFVTEGVTQEELDAAKKFLLGSEPLRNELLNQRISAAFSEYYKGLPLGYRDEELAKIDTLQLEDLNNYIKSHNEIKNLTFSVITAKEDNLEEKKGEKID